MTAQSFHYPEPMIPSDSEVELARNSSRILASLNLKNSYFSRVISSLLSWLQDRSCLSRQRIHV